MKCVKPVRVVDKSTAGGMSVPCGRCIACRLNYSSMWSLRMMHEKMMHEKSVFLTLTYRDECLPENMSLVKKDVQDFFKRLRKNTGQKVRYFLAGEYGDNFKRPHYHAVVYGMDSKSQSEFEKAWTNGFVYCGTVTDDSCTYVAKYVVKKKTGLQADIYKKNGVIPEFALMSRRPGIGGDYAKKYSDEIASRGFLLKKGNKVGVPRFYRGRVYGTDEDALLDVSRSEKRSSDSRKKKLEDIQKVGYDLIDKNEMLSRESRLNNLVAKTDLRKRKI